MPKYTNLKVPKELSDRVDEIVSMRLDGYRTRGEFMNGAIRAHLKLYEDTLKNPFPHFKVRKDSVTIYDRVKDRLVDIHFNGLRCSLCEESDCEHVRFALTIPEVVEAIEKAKSRESLSHSSEKT